MEFGEVFGLHIIEIEHHEVVVPNQAVGQPLFAIGGGNGVIGQVAFQSVGFQAITNHQSLPDFIYRLAVEAAVNQFYKMFHTNLGNHFGVAFVAGHFQFFRAVVV
ncbi:hypothetical protein GGR06_000171 [Bacteroides reticulotermitis]|uniref:Uncharacterized protein n=1 Tax=Bacteroides reticulotermitis TaxID=1133319 RepID=A0A840D1N6_9BACE|nr:hypothetical protein [Bacteroides reticulotermitis]MBB4042412.1 hypothetical protein [Bacteroides reticulotermitis]